MEVFNCFYTQPTDHMNNAYKFSQTNEIVCKGIKNLTNLVPNLNLHKFYANLVICFESVSHVGFRIEFHN